MNTVSKRFSSIGLVGYIIASLFLLYEMAVQVSPSVMVTQLMRDLDISSATLGFMASTYFWSYTTMQIVVGLLYDRFSAKFLLLSAILIVTIGIFFFSTTHEIWALSLGRFLTGFGSAFAFVGVLVIAARWFPVRYFALLVGIAQLLAAVGAASGEGPLSLMVDDMGWRHAALVLSVVGLVLFVLVALFMRRHRSEKEGRQAWSWRAIWRSLRHVLGHKQLWWLTIYAFFSWGPIAIFASMWGVPYLMQRFSITNTEASWVCAMIWGLLALTSPIIGGLSQRIHAIRLMRWVAWVGAVGGIAILYWPHLSLPGAYLAAAAIGVGAAGQILAFEVARQHNLKDDFGFSVSLVNVGVVAGGALLQPLSAWLLHHHEHGTVTSHIERFTTGDFQYALFLVPVCFLLCLVISYGMIRRPPSNSHF